MKQMNSQPPSGTGRHQQQQHQTGSGAFNLAWYHFSPSLASDGDEALLAKSAGTTTIGHGNSERSLHSACIGPKAIAASAAKPVIVADSKGSDRCGLSSTSVENALGLASGLPLGCLPFVPAESLAELSLEGGPTLRTSNGMTTPENSDAGETGTTESPSTPECVEPMAEFGDGGSDPLDALRRGIAKLERKAILEQGRGAKCNVALDLVKRGLRALERVRPVAHEP